MGELPHQDHALQALSQWLSDETATLPVRGTQSAGHFGVGLMVYTKCM